jgi:hypothetical protein
MYFSMKKLFKTHSYSRQVLEWDKIGYEKLNMIREKMLVSIYHSELFTIVSVWLINKMEL